MPISLRLPPDTENQIAEFGARQGLSKSAVIVRSIQEFLSKHAQPSSLDIYEAAMRAVPEDPSADAVRAAAEQRPHKRQARDALRQKHAERSARASGALGQQPHQPGTKPV